MNYSGSLNPLFSDKYHLKKTINKTIKRNNSPGVQYYDNDGKAYNPWHNYSFSGHLRPWPLTVFRSLPNNIIKPDYAVHPENIPVSEINHPKGKIVVLNDEEITKMRKVCRLAREVMDEVSKIITVGITTEYIDQVVHEACIARNSYPSPLTYYKFPKSVCTSVNEVVCHGIPDSRPLQDGDIVNVDITLYHDGFHGDLNETFAVGTIDPSSIKLLTITHECISKAIEIVKPGVAYKEIGELIEAHANKFGYSVVRNYTGHGINRLFHCPPTVYHRKNNYKGIMMVGHTFTIEPMINIGLDEVDEWPDDWTVVTRDGKRSAQFEQTLLVTQEGCEILTARKDFPNSPYFLDQIKQLQLHDFPTN